MAKTEKSAKKSAKSNAKNLLPRVQKCVDKKIRPFIQMDGGEIELVELTPKNVLKVKLHGACRGCPMASATLQYGVQNALNEEFPTEDIQLQLIEN